MGWFTSSSSPSAEKTQTPTSTPDSAIPSTTTSTPNKPPPSRDELAEQELNNFLRELEADVQPSSTKYQRVSRTDTPSATTTTESDPNEPLSSQLLPTSMSCRTAFDAAFYCQSFGGQFNNLYRYGAMRDCSETWSDFWFCMKTRGYPDHEKGKMIKERWREKERVKYGVGVGATEREIGRSSEDVWRGRERRLKWGEAFCKSEEEAEEWRGSDEEWRVREREWREKRRDGMTS